MTSREACGYAMFARATRYSLEELEAAYAAGLAARVPEGWKLVPVEPTKLQIIKGENALYSISDGDFRATQSEIEYCYAAMLAAAPEPTK